MIFRNVIDVAFIDEDFFMKIIILTMLSWLPLHIFKKAKSYYFPNDYEKIMANYRAKRREIINDL